MIRDVINGEVCETVRTRLTRCRLLALNKPMNGVRPIAVGLTLLKVCGTILLQRHEEKIKDFFHPVQRRVLQRNACEGIVHTIAKEYEEGYTILAVDYANAYNTPTRQSIYDALKKCSIFKPFMRLFALESPSDLRFFANDTLHSTIKSTSGVRQGSALSSLYFCALIQDSLKDIEELFPEVKVRAYMDDITLSSRDPATLEAAFLHLREASNDLGLKVNFSKCEWFKKASDSAYNQEQTPQSLQDLGMSATHETIKILGAYIGNDQIVSNLLVRKLEKHKCLFRRLYRMGPSNLSLAILQKCTNPRQDYHIRVHKPDASLELAQQFDTEIGNIVSHWFQARGDSLRLTSLPEKLGGLGLTPSCLKHKYFYSASRRSIEEQGKSLNAPVEKSKHTKKISVLPENKSTASKMATKAIRGEK